jgi:hypothetical protein
VENDEANSDSAGDPEGKRIRYHDDSTHASDPIPAEVADRRLKWFCPELYGWSGRKGQNRRWRDLVVEHMSFGDSRAALVVSMDPLLVAAYTDELDCVAMLRFSPSPPDRELAFGSRLLTVNTYKRGATFDSDLDLGPERIERWVGFHPIIADFICADQGIVDRRKAEIGEREWERAFQFGMDYLDAHPGVSRDGSPRRSLLPAS